MGFSNLIAIAIIMTTAATPHASGKTNVESSSQAAEAETFGGRVRRTDLRAWNHRNRIPRDTGAGWRDAYAIGESRKWPVGLSRKPKEALAFYGVLSLSAALGVALNFTAMDPIKALYWSAVINGVLAAPVIVIMMLLARRKSVMGDLVVKGPVYWLGWISTAAMGLCIVGMAASMGGL